ncbi:receptor-type tyrosine-protein phosphatase mu-like, partial [Asbolus verrucosus]
IEIENLLITNIHNSYATLQWDSPYNVQCVKTYIVYINNIEYRNTSNTSILVTNLAACVQYEVAVAVFDGNSTRNVIQNNFTTTVPKHLEVTNLSVVKRENFGVILRWDPPKNVQCVDTYVVYLNGKNRSNTSNANISITGLQACKQYKVGIAVFDGHKIGKTIQTTFKTTVPKPFNYSVQNIKTVATGKMLNITWETPPKSVLQCVTGYYLWWQDDEDDKTRQRVKTNQTYVELPLIGCMHYQIEIYPIVSDGLDAPSQSKSYIGEFPTKAPQIIPQIQDKTYANVKWITESENKCKLIQIVAICDAPDDINDDYPWINKHQKTVLNVTTFKSNQFIMSINNLSSFTNYTCEGFTVNTAGKSDVQIFNISTNEDVPSAPEPIDIVEVGAHNFRIKWTKPSVIPGIMSSYGLLIRNDGPNFARNERCPNLSHITDHYFSANVSQNSFDFNNAMPYYNYTISVYGIDRAGNGSNATVQVTTKAIKPDNVTNPQLLPPLYSEEEKYFAMATLKFDPPCKMNGPFRFYQIHLNGQRDGFASDETDISTGETTNNLTLLPERVYSIKISVVTEGFSSSVSLPSFKSRPGVPSLGPLQPPTSNDSTKAYFKLSRNGFDDTNGEILDYVLILFSKFPSADKTYGFWSDSDNKTWPSILYNSEGKVAPYHIIKILRNPFKNGVNNIDFVIGEDDTCSDDIVCNKPLKQDTEYFLIVRALTSATFKDSPPLYFKTGTQNNVGLGLGNEEGNSSPTSLPASIACKKFSDYYETIKENQTILKSQYTALASQNDETRVKLKIDEDDEISSDYINASYIKVFGYSGKVEYIATQGPLASTSKDFWKMIVQENVTIIVMVSQFVEQSKVIYSLYSAGVGRTGTLIALDILFQTIDHQKDINIYKTVFDLRKQRTHMVQTEKQYVFIHTCIKDYLETPIVQSNVPEIRNLNIDVGSFNATVKWDPPQNAECVETYFSAWQYSMGLILGEYGVENLTVLPSDKVLNVTWQHPPEEVLRCVTSYYLVWWGNGTQSHDKTIFVPQTYAELPLIGCMYYEIQIYPKCDEKNGRLLLISYTADELPTNAPQITKLTNNETSANVIWKTDDKSINECELIQIVATCNAPDADNSDYPWVVKHKQTVLDITTPTPSYTFPMTITNLSAFTNYTCQGLVTNIAEDVPSAPEPVEIAEIGSHNFRIKWTKPSIIPGIMTSYGLLIHNNGPNFVPNEECSNSSNLTDFYYPVDVTKNSFDFTKAMPYHNYTISVYGIDGAGNGTEATASVTTQTAEPDNVMNPQLLPPSYSEDETYSAVATLKFGLPCNLNGPFKYYQIKVNGKRNGFQDDEYHICINNTNADLDLKPERNYSVEISVITEDFNSSLSKNAFSNTNGEILYYALILLSKSDSVDKTYGFWNNSDETWPSVPNGSGNGLEPYQLTPIQWNPFKSESFPDYFYRHSITILDGSDTIDFIIGNDKNCSGNFCNKPLEEDTKYTLIVRALTSATYKDLQVDFKTDDQTRVKLKTDEDDEIASDYINASYIKGYSGKIEYIATQGPLETTSKDFWKMIVQENVTIIVMVSQFVEQCKEKCYRYFPNNHEHMSFGESLSVRCLTELHFGTYCIRTLQIKKDNEQRNVFHMQFLEWPDFGVPQSADNMLQFCNQMREKANVEGGLIVVHCSAGVGRTGTLIALDILLQTIDHHRDINIYKTVLDLRKQRANMVQTEKQYLFIHTCIKEYMEIPKAQSNGK